MKTEVNGGRLSTKRPIFGSRTAEGTINPCSVLPERDSGCTHCLRGGYPDSDSGNRRLKGLITACRKFTHTLHTTACCSGTGEELGATVTVALGIRGVKLMLKLGICTRREIQCCRRNLVQSRHRCNEVLLYCPAMMVRCATNLPALQCHGHSTTKAYSGTHIRLLNKKVDRPQPQQ